MRVSGILPLRNGVRLGYPFELAIRSLRPLCDEVVVLVDPTSEDDTLARVRALGPARIVESPWDMANHGGHEGRSEIARQTGIALGQATGDWVLSLQADELLHEAEAATLRADIERAEAEGAAGIELERLYFYGGLHQYRADWSMPLLRLFKRGRFAPDGFCGAMTFVQTRLVYPGRGGCEPERVLRSTARIYHYSRVGDPQTVSRRVANLDGFYHPRETVAASPPAYDFGELRKLDSYVQGHVAEVDPAAVLVPFDPAGHPAGVVEYFADA